jgi:hypothetical protein
MIISTSGMDLIKVYLSEALSGSLSHISTSPKLAFPDSLPRVLAYTARGKAIGLHVAIAFRTISHTQVVTNNFSSMHSHIVHSGNYCVYNNNYVNHYVYVHVM